MSTKEILILLDECKTRLKSGKTDTILAEELGAFLESWLEEVAKDDDIIAPSKATKSKNNKIDEGNNSFELWTDGACSGNPGPGGWAFVLKTSTGEYYQKSGFSKHATNNVMELTAVIKALESIPDGSSLILRSDSQYVLKGIQGWINKWKRNGWLTTEKKPVANKELWMRLDELSAKRKIRWDYVKGHADEELNNLCDELAREEISKNR